MIKMISPKKKKLLCEYVDYRCELCSQSRKYALDELEINRIKRGYLGGTYEFRNCQVLCITHHKKIHQNEFPHISKP